MRKIAKSGSIKSISKPTNVNSKSRSTKKNVKRGSKKIRRICKENIMLKRKRFHKTMKKLSVI